MVDRFDLEQSILSCWNITDDINLLHKRGAKKKEYVALADVYQHKFNELWDIFETLVHEKQFVKG